MFSQFDLYPYPLKGTDVNLKQPAAVLLAAATTLALTACGDSNEWESAEQKSEAFSAYQCQNAKAEDPWDITLETSQQILDSNYDSNVKNDAQGFITLDREGMRDRATVRDSAFSDTFNDYGPYYPGVTLDGQTCEGWIWKWHQVLSTDEFENFTPADAREAGVLD